MVTGNLDMYELLKNRAIIDILIGDKKYDKYTFDDGSAVDISMPYMSGPDLCEVSTMFGLPMTYERGKGARNFSRWEYLDKLITHCMTTKKCSALLGHVFNKEQFAKMFSDRKADEIESAYQFIVNELIQKINGILYFGGHELTIINNQFIVKTIGVNVTVDAPKIKSIDREYIKNISHRAMQDVEKGNYDSAITKSRTLLEETFCYVIELKKETPSGSGKIKLLYNQVKKLYNMHEVKDADRRVSNLLSGLDDIVSAIAEMRNKDSDSHGVGEKRITIDAYHARLFVNSAITMADFILSVALNQMQL